MNGSILMNGHPTEIKIITPVEDQTYVRQGTEVF